MRFRFVFVSPGFSSLDCGQASPGLSLRSWCLIELLTLIKNTFRGCTLWVLGLRFCFVFVSPGVSSLDCGEASPGLSLRAWCLIELLTLIRHTFRGSTLWVLGLRFCFVFVSPGFSSLDCGGASPGLSLRSGSRIELLTLIKAFWEFRQLSKSLQLNCVYKSRQN